MASPEPTFLPVSSPKASAPAGFSVNSTIGWPNCPWPGRALLRSRPVTVRRFSTA
jgi:hypothetical protein